MYKMIQMLPDMTQYSMLLDVNVSPKTKFNKHLILIKLNLKVKFCTLYSSKYGNYNCMFVVPIFNFFLWYTVILRHPAWGHVMSHIFNGQDFQIFRY